MVAVAVRGELSAAAQAAEELGRIANIGFIRVGRRAGG